MIYKRNCPKCNKEIIYANKYNLKNAEEKNSFCKSCAVKSGITEEERIKKKERFSGKNNPMHGKTGEENPFYGKKHSAETIDIFKNVDRSYTKTDEFRKKISNVTIGKNNPMYNRSMHECWVEKYGEDIANLKLIGFKEKQSKLSKGNNNPMFGKTSPKGSGNGWSGWYNGWFFRSILELSYMINIIERFKLKWENAEIAKYKVPYKINNFDRTYRADFIINSKYMLEIKPVALRNTEINILKKNAAISFCKNTGLIYKITSCRILTDQEIAELFNTDKIKFTKICEIKYNNKYKSNGF